MRMEDPPAMRSGLMSSSWAIVVRALGVVVVLLLLLLGSDG